MNIFERASRANLMFSCSRGLVGTSALWSLSLQDLDTLARRINKDIKAEGEESFIESQTESQELRWNKLRLDILKHIIASKQSDMAAAQTRAEKDAKRRRLAEVLAKKRDAALEEMSEDEILKELEELDN